MNRGCGAIALAGDVVGRCKLFQALAGTGTRQSETSARVPVADATLEALAVKAETRRKFPASLEVKLTQELKGERSAGRAWVMVFSAEEGMGGYRKFVDEISDLDGELLSSRLRKVSGKTRSELEEVLRCIEKRELKVVESEISKYTVDLISTRPWLVVENFHTPICESEISSYFRSTGSTAYMGMNAEMECELQEISDDNFRQEYLASLGFKISMLPSLVQRLPGLLGQGVFYTVGDVETRAWLYPKTAKISEASAAIHSDFAKKFLHADVVKVAEYLKLGKKAKTSQKGREYDLEDACDIVDFKLKK